MNVEQRLLDIIKHLESDVDSYQQLHAKEKEEQPMTVYMQNIELIKKEIEIIKETINQVKEVKGSAFK